MLVSRKARAPLFPVTFFIFFFYVLVFCSRYFSVYLDVISLFFLYGYFTDWFSVYCRF